MTIQNNNQGFQKPIMEGPVCPVPLQHNEQIVMGHGSGGRMTQSLIENIFYKYFKNDYLSAGNDFANIPLQQNATLAVSTDSHIISPIFYPGGDIGKLSICGTVNDVAVSGAVPKFITAGFILEEGFLIQDLEKIVISMKETADEAGVQIVAGDTKVAEKGKVDRIFINTTGIGWIPESRNISGNLAKPGDKVIISGTIGDHGIAILSARGELGFETLLKSDTAPLNHLIQNILEAAPHTHVLRDPTRGGVASTLNEIACQSNVCVKLYETQIPIKPEVRSACEMLGFDPLYIANEGKVIVIVPENEANAALEAIKSHSFGKDAQIIGEVMENPQNQVLLETRYGSNRIVDRLSGEMLPRIC